MRLLVADHIANARQSLRANRMRTVLTMVGIAIGVASITTILALSSGATKIVTDQVEEQGGTVAVIRPGVMGDQLEKLATPSPYQSYASSTLTEKDAADIAGLPSVQAAAPIMILRGSVKGDAGAPSDTAIVGSTPKLADVANLEVRDGQFIDSVTNRDTVVIGSQLSIDLFGTDQSIGKNLTIRSNTFTVIGILKRANNPVNYSMVDFDKAAIVSLENGKRFHQDSAQIQQITIKSADAASLPKAVEDSKQTLLKNHAGEQDFTILTGKEISQPTSQIFFVLTGATTAVAFVALLVGGIGIMNIMLVSVAERTREIGIRKALGASSAHIVWQFLIEALALSVGGGIIGYLLGYASAFTISTFLTFDPSFSWQIAAVAIGVAIVTGTLFGLYPALRAARRDPIEALRQYH